MTANDPYADEAGRLRTGVQDQLREGTEPCLTPYEQFLLLGWYERELHRLETSRDDLGAKVDRNFAARLEADRRSHAAVEALERAADVLPPWQEKR